MSWRKFLVVKEAVLIAAAFLLVVPQALAGGTVHAGNRAVTRAEPVVVPVVRPLVRAVATITLVVHPPAQPAVEPVFVALRGPDGQSRRFLVEGGRAAIQSPQVVLRAGQSVTIQWVAAK